MRSVINAFALLVISLSATPVSAQASQKVAQAPIFEDRRRLPDPVNAGPISESILEREAATQRYRLRKQRKFIAEERRKRMAAEAELEAARLKAQQAEERLKAAQASLQKRAPSTIKEFKTTVRPAKSATQQNSARTGRLAAFGKVDRGDTSDKERIATRLKLAPAEADHRSRKAVNSPARPKPVRRRHNATAAAGSLIGKVIKLRLKGSAYEISGQLRSFNRTQYVIRPPNSHNITVPAHRFDCVSDNCPSHNPN